MSQPTEPTKEPQPITSFTGKYRWLSNFYPHPIWPEWWPKTLPPFPSNEHAFAAWKVDPAIGVRLWLERVEEIRNAANPRAAKQLGRNVKLRPDWDEKIRIPAMAHLQAVKFQDAYLEKLLVATHPQGLIEGNQHGDDFWGCIEKDGQWVGENHLGRLLEHRREILVRNSSRS